MKNIYVYILSAGTEMNEESLLSADREKYWKNRLTRTCIYCGTDLMRYAITNSNSLFRYDSCGHTFCYNCNYNQSHQGNCRNCGVKKTTTKPVYLANLQEDANEYNQEILQQVMKYKFDLEEKSANLEKEHANTLENHKTKLEKEAAERITIEANKSKTKQVELEQKISLLEEELVAIKAKDSEDAVPVICMDCGYDMIFEKSRICVTCGVEHGLLTKEIADNMKENVSIVSFDKVEVSLLCGSCVLEGEHEDHKTVNYFNLKKKQMSSSQNNEMNLRFESAFDKDWENVCKKMEKCHLPVVELLEKCGKETSNSESWTKFERMQTRLNSLVRRAVDHKSNMVGSIHKYSGEMKSLLAEAQAILDDAVLKNRNKSKAISTEEAHTVLEHIE